MRGRVASESATSDLRPSAKWKFLSRDRWSAALAVAALIPVFGLAQQIIENPEKPVAKNAGRILEFNEIWRVKDDSGDFFFKYPYQLQIAGDGTIFLADEGEFLRFTRDGKFEKNLFKKGEGPGEISSSFTYFIRGDELVIRDSMKRKVWSTDYEGNLKKEFELPATGYSSLIGVRKDDFVFTQTVMPPAAERTGRLMEIPHAVYLTAMDGKRERTVFTFHSQEFMHPKAGRSWTPAIAVLCPDGQHIVGSYDLKYKIQIVHIDKSEVVRTFSREYPRVRHVIDDYERKFNEQSGSPAMEFKPDVIGIKLVGEVIWIRTSTSDPKKGDLWDVFSMDGKFLDSFFIGAGRTLLRVEPDCLFVTEKTADETLALVKYKFSGKGGGRLKEAGL
jgi:hypothetical protein